MTDLTVKELQKYASLQIECPKCGKFAPFSITSECETRDFVVGAHRCTGLLKEKCGSIMSISAYLEVRRIAHALGLR